MILLDLINLSAFLFLFQPFRRNPQIRSVQFEADEQPLNPHRRNRRRPRTHERVHHDVARNRPRPYNSVEQRHRFLRWMPAVQFFVQLITEWRSIPSHKIII